MFLNALQTYICLKAYCHAEKKFPCNLSGQCGLTNKASLSSFQHHPDYRPICQPPLTAPSSTAPICKPPPINPSSINLHNDNLKTSTIETQCVKPRNHGLLHYRKWWELNEVELMVNGQLIRGTPIFTEENTLRVVNNQNSYFIPLDKVDFIRTCDGLPSDDLANKAKSF